MELNYASCGPIFKVEQGDIIVMESFALDATRATLRTNLGEHRLSQLEEQSPLSSL